jgi:glycosyltransferase involved in cell wall biosynthesis
VRPKILHVTQSTGGVETSLLLLLRHLDRQRFEFHLACPPHTKLAVGARALGIPVYEIPMVRRVDPWWDCLALARLVRLLRRERYALLHAHSAKGGYLGRLAARLAGRPRTVYSPRAFSYLSQRGVARTVFLALERLAVPWTDLLHATSESEKTRAVREVGFPSARVVVIPNSVDLAQAETVHSGRPVGDGTVLTVGRLAYQKNPEMFVRVARRVLDHFPGTKFAIVGAGFASPLERRVAALIRSLGLEGDVEIVPWADRAKTLNLMGACSVFVLTSRFEGMPNTVLEAMMLRKPVVATDVDGSRDVLGAGTGGFLVPLDDDQAMADRVIGLLGDPTLARRVGEAGRQRVRDCYDIHRNAETVDALYGQLLDA